MAKPWNEVASSPAYKALAPEQQDGARRQYFDAMVAPRVPEDQREAAFSQFSTDTGIGKRALPAGVSPSLAGGGRGSVNPSAETAQSPQLSLADAKPVLSRAQRIAELDAETDPTNPDYLPITANAQTALRTDARGQLDDKRTKSPGRVLDRNLPPATFGSVAQDVAAGALQIIPTAAKGVGDIARLATGDRVGKGLSDYAQRSMEAAQQVVGSDRAAAQRQRFEQDMQDPALNPADVIVGNPGALTDQVLPTVGSMALPIAAAGIAGKLATGSRAAQLAAAIDGGTVAARANAARQAAVIGTTVAQNAGDTFSTVRDAGGDQAQSYLAAAITAPATYLAGRLTGGGAEGKLAKTFAGQVGKTGAAAVVKGAAKEGAQEIGEETGQYLGETVGLGQELDANAYAKRAAVAGTLGAVVGGGVDVGTATVQRMRAVGETDVADLLEKKNAVANTERELEVLNLFAPEHTAHPNYQAAYTAARAGGVKPAEASARAGITAGFGELAINAGLSQKAIDSALEAAKKLPMTQVPNFLEKFTTALTAKGMGTAIEPGTMAKTLATLGDNAMTAAVETLYPANDVRNTMADVETLEKQQNKASMPAERAQTAIENVAERPVNEDQSTATVAAFDTVPTPIAEGNELQPAAAGPLLASDGTQFDNQALNDVQNTAQDSAQPGATAEAAPVEAPAPALDRGAGPTAAREQAGTGVVQAAGLNPRVPQENRQTQVVSSTQSEKALASAATPAAPVAERPATWRTNMVAAAKVARDLKIDPKGKKLGALVADIDAADKGIESNAPVGQQTSVQDASETIASDQPLGRNSIPLSEGGKPFKTSKAAQDARKLNKTMRVTRVEGGFALKPASEAQLAAADRAGRKMALPRTSPPGEAIPAHAFIAAEGGLTAGSRSDMGMEGNVRVGNRSLFAGDGRGLTIENALERLVEDGYLQEGASDDDARNLIKRSLTNPQYTPEGTERMADKMADERAIAYQAEQEALAELQSGSDNQHEAIAENDADIPWDTADSNMSTEAAMRLMGFTEEEITDAIANESRKPSEDLQDNRGLDEGSTTTTQGTVGVGKSPPGEDTRSRSNARRQETQVTERTQTPADAGVSTSAPPFDSALRPDGTLAIKGDAKAIREALNAIPAKSLVAMKGGILVGRTQADKAAALLRGETPKLTAREAQQAGEAQRSADKAAKSKAARAVPAPSQGLSVGLMATRTEPVTVKDGSVFIGEYEAVDFESGEPITVKAGATDTDVKKALIDGGALSSKQKIFGGKTEGLTAPTRADVLDQQDRKENADALDQRAQIDREASSQTLTAQTAPEQRRDSSGDMFAKEKAEAEIEKRNAGRAGNDDSNQQGMFARGAGTNPDIRFARNTFDAEAFRRAYSPPTALSVAKAEAFTKELSAKWKSGPAIRVVATPKDFPVDAPLDARGLIHEGTAWIAARNHRSRDDVARTLGHEAIGHYGLWKSLGADGRKSFERNIKLALVSGNVPLNKIADKVKRLYVDDKGKFNLSPKELANEIAAFAVEDAIDAVSGEFKTGYGFVKAVYAKVAEFLRGLGITVKFTNAELQGMLVSATRGLEAGKRLDGGMQGLIAAARDGIQNVSRTLRASGAARSTSPGKTPLYEAFRQLARYEDAFQTAGSDSKELGQIASEMQSKTAGRYAGFTADKGTALHQGNRKPVLTLRSTNLAGDSVKLLDIFEPESKRPFVVIGNSELGQGARGARAYQIAFAWAHNNGKTMRPDPAGLTVINRLRRTEAMISSALRFGTTQHLEPHQDQYIALTERARARRVESEDTHYSGNPDIFNELEALKKKFWTAGDDADTMATNVQHLIEASGQLAAIREPDIRDLEVVDGAIRRRGVVDAVRLADIEPDDARSTAEIFGVNLRPASSGVGRSTAVRYAVSASLGRALQRQQSAVGPQPAAGRGDTKNGSDSSNADLAAVRAIRQIVGDLSGPAPGVLKNDVFYARSGVEGSESRGIDEAMKPQNDVVGNQGGRAVDDNFPEGIKGTSVVDPEGKPLLVYHGTKGEILNFDRKKTIDGAFHFGTEPQAQMRAGTKGNLVASYLFAENLSRSRDAGGNWKSKIASAKANGKDGIVYLNRYEGISRETVNRAYEQKINLDSLTDQQFRKFAPEAKDSYIVFDDKQVIRPNQPTTPDRDNQGGRSADDTTRGTDENTGLPLNADGTVTLYHHTSAAAAQKIRATGRLQSEAEPDVYVTTRREADTGYGDTAVPIKVEPAKLQIDDEFPDGRKDFRLNVGKPGGSIKVTVANESPATNSGSAFALGTGNLFQPNIWRTPDPTRTDNFIYELQDANVDLKRVQEAITKSGQVIEEKWDARLAETLYPGRVAHRSDSFLKSEVQPLIDAMARNKVDMAELADYLHARGAEERNAQIAKVNPSMPDGGAGTNTKGELMTNVNARGYLAAVRPARKVVLDAMAKRVDTITKGTRTLLVTEGLEKQETIDAWEGAYKNYVPMFRDEAEDALPPHPQGSGFTVKGGSSKRATGSTKEVTNILAHVLMQREAAITRAEKNRVALALYGQALSHPNPDFWTTMKPSMDAAEIGAELQAMGVDPMTAQVGMEGIPTIRTVDPLTNKVVDRANPMYRNLPGAIPLKVNGEDRVLMLNVKTERGMRLATSLKNLDGLTQLDIAGNIVGKSTRWLAAVNTQYNPAFGLVNLTRDVMEGALNIGSTQLRGNSMRVLFHVPEAIQGVARQLAGNDNKWGKLYEQFVADGGQTGFKESFRDPQERAKAIEKMLASVDRSKLTPGLYAHAALDLLDGFNTTLESAVRLSAYKVALDKNMTRSQAARLARELTVDFNRKGRTGREIGPLFAFFNASVQGAERSLRTLKGPTGSKIIAGGLAMGVIQALMLAAAGYDDDEVPEFVKTNAFVIPLNWTGKGEKRHTLIPMPLGFKMIPNTSRVLTELTMNGGKDAGKRMIEAIGVIASSFNPLGGGNIFTADGALKTFAPTLIDPVIEIGFNRNFAGGTIEKESYGGETDGRPGYQRAKEATQRATTGQAYLGISKAMNTLTGGNEYEAGGASWTPERIQYLAQVAGGGVLREIEKTVNASVRASTGDKVKSSQIPVLGRFYGETDDNQVQQSRYYGTSKKVKTADSSFQAALKAGDGEAAEAMLNKNPDLAMAKSFSRTQQAISKLNKLAVGTVSNPAELRDIDEARVSLMRELNEAMRELERERGAVTLVDRFKKVMVPLVAKRDGNTPALQ